MDEKCGATRRRFYTATEVTNHNSENDCWVSIFHKVYDLTEFLSFNQGAEGGAPCTRFDALADAAAAVRPRCTY